MCDRERVVAVARRLQQHLARRAVEVAIDKDGHFGRSQSCVSCVTPEIPTQLARTGLMATIEQVPGCRPDALAVQHRCSDYGAYK